tara:strand:- start:1569 stop:1943 length:375 start_codon:yes stop_codon:yes gene_type:complete
MIRSIVLLLLVSAGAALFFSEFNITYWKAFLFTLILQLVAWNLFTNYQRAQIVRNSQLNEQEFIQNIGKQEVEVPCAACSHANLTVVQLNSANTFECEACDVKNALYINMEAVAMTVVGDVKER